MAYMGPQWCGEAAEAEQALEHSSQAVRYLLTGKEECVRKAVKVMYNAGMWLVCPLLCASTSKVQHAWIVAGLQ